MNSSLHVLDNSVLYFTLAREVLSSTRAFHWAGNPERCTD